MITLQQYTTAANMLGVDVATLRAVAAVESSGKGFGADGRPLILFEPHQFYRELTKRGIRPSLHTLGNGDILYAKWGTRPYPATQAARYKQLERAKKINEDAALCSASYGAFQIMGFNHAACRCKTVQQFVSLMGESEYSQLLLFCAFVQSRELVMYLKKRDWAGFALRYNGKSYKVNKYDEKLAAAWKKYAAAASNQVKVAVIKK